MRANYNANHCAGERKPAGARTMDINEKTMPRTMENNEKGELRLRSDAEKDARRPLCT